MKNRTLSRVSVPALVSALAPAVQIQDTQGNCQHQLLSLHCPATKRHRQNKWSYKNLFEASDACEIALHQTFLVDSALHLCEVTKLDWYISFTTSMYGENVKCGECRVSHTHEERVLCLSTNLLTIMTKTRSTSTRHVPVLGGACCDILRARIPLGTHSTVKILVVGDKKSIELLLYRRKDNIYEGKSNQPSTLQIEYRVY